MKRTRGILMGLALAATMAGRASATDWLGNAGGATYCGGNTFSTCFSVNLSWTLTGTGATLVLKLTKVSGPDTKWFSVGLDNLPSGTTFAVGTVPSGYGAPPPNDFSGGPFVDVRAWAACNGGCTPPASQATWNFTLTKTGLTDAQLQAAGVGLHAGGATINNTSCSTKVVVRDNLAAGAAYGTNGPDGSAPLCEGGDTNTSVPEPVTMSLMALGLVGLGGAGMIRRRRKV